MPALRILENDMYPTRLSDSQEGNGGSFFRAALHSCFIPDSRKGRRVSAWIATQARDGGLLWTRR